MNRKIAFIVILISALCICAVSFSNFQPDNWRIDTDPADNDSLFPHVSSDNNGNVYVIWYDERAGTEVYFNRSDDYGATWASPDVQIGTTDNPETLSIGSDDNGHVYATWLDGSAVVLARSSDYGQSWITGGIAGSTSDYDFDFSANGNLVVVWKTINEQDLFANYSLDYGASWQGPVSVVTIEHYYGDFHRSPSVTVDNSGHVYVAWLDDRGWSPLEHITYFNRSYDFGQTWQGEFPISANNWGVVNKDPIITCDNTGHVYVAWAKDQYGSPFQYVLEFTSSADYGNSWPNQHTLATRTDKHRLLNDDNGNVYLIWNDIANAPWNKVNSRSSFDYGATWQPVTALIDSADDPHNCELGRYDVDIDGKHIFVAWENLEPWQGIFFNYSLNGGQSWRDVLIRADNNPGETVVTNTPSVSAGPDGHVYVAWEDRRNETGDIFFNQGDFWGLSLEEKIRLEAEYLLACQYNDPGHTADGAFNDVYTPDAPPDYVVPRENAMAILGLLKAYEVLGDDRYLDGAIRSMDYLVRTQEPDGSWKDEYDYRNPEGGLQTKSPTQPAEVMIAMYMLGFNEDRYEAMKSAAQFLFACQDNGYQGLICGGKDAQGGFSTWNWITDNSYAYWALRAACSWAQVMGETDFAAECEQAATDIINGINLYMYNGLEWWQVVDNEGNLFNNEGIVDWLNFSPQFLDLPATGVGNEALGEWIHETFQHSNGGCLWGERHPNQEYPGISFQSAFCWLDLGQDAYANAAINWAETSSLWQLVPDEYSISGGWVDWFDVTDPMIRAGGWERYIDTSFYAIASWLGGYDFTVVDNLPPQLEPIGDKSVYVNNNLTFQVYADDPDILDELVFSAENLPAGAAFDPETQVFFWRPGADQVGAHSIRFVVSDGFLIDYEDIVITVRRRGHGCFLEGTPITMADGTKKPIEEIKIGDVVLAYDEEAQLMKPDKVTRIFHHDKEDVYLVINGELKVTPVHRMLSKGEWVEIGKLEVGDTLTNTEGKDVSIDTIEEVSETVSIYNFEVNPYHTYVAGGYIVHNRKALMEMVDWGGVGP